MLSVWHRQAGWVVGGGNSKFDPRFATFEVWKDGAWQAEPDGVSFRRDGSKEVATFRYGNHRARMAIGFEKNDRLTLILEGDAPRRGTGVIRVNLLLPMTPGDRLRYSGNGVGPSGMTLHPHRFWFHNFQRAGQLLRQGGRGWLLKVPKGCFAEYPVYRYNPYELNGASPPESGQLRLSCEIESNRKVVFQFTGSLNTA